MQVGSRPAYGQGEKLNLAGLQDLPGLRKQAAVICHLLHLPYNAPISNKEIPMPERFTVVPVMSVLHNEAALHALVETYRPAFARIGGGDAPAANVPQVLFVVTGGTEQRVLDLWMARASSAPEDPLFLVAHPGHNSLPAALEVLARLQQLGIPGRIFYLASPDDEAGLAQLDAALHALDVRRGLRAARIGLVGVPSEWLVASTPDIETVRQTWGPQVVVVDMEDLYETLAGVEAEAITAQQAALVEAASAVCEPAPDALADGVRVYLALRQLVEQYGLDALTVRCFDLVLNLKTTGCFALAQLNDEGVIAGCEGDLVSTVGMLWAYRLLGQLPWMANPARLDETHNTLWLAHCTVPRSLVQQYRLRSHFESGLGVGLQGTLAAGPVTLLRLGGLHMERLWLAEGHIKQSGDAEDLCRTQIEVRLTNGGVGELLRAPLGNHIIVIQGHHAARLRTWWETYIMRKS